MGRWAPGAQGRLEEAAMELFEERGFEDTTVADIAAHAGLTKRTFFRYFGDKREVLFSGSEALRAKFVAAIAAAPADATPLEAIAIGLDAMADLFASIGERPRRRQAIIAANPDLQERELIKMIGFAAAGAGALRERGVAEPAASLAAEAGIAVLRIAFERWATGPEGQDIHELLRDSLAELKAVAA
ncbi:MAG: TetR family transcriptional regulator [Actinobacteria bacterium]|nr:TetR family transcriptional regulator [Actinomycetota bacterium]